MTTTYHHGNLRHDLLTEASRVLEEEGADAISLRGLARSLGVSHAAPSHHFADRAGLLAELAADGFRALGDALETAMDLAHPSHWLAETGRAYVRFGISNPERYRLMFASQVMADNCPDRLLEESTRAYLLLLRAVYRREHDVSERDDYRLGPAELAAWSMVHGAVMLWIDGQLTTAPVTEAHILELTDSILETYFSKQV